MSGTQPILAVAMSLLGESGKGAAMAIWGNYSLDAYYICFDRCSAGQGSAIFHYEAEDELFNLQYLTTANCDSDYRLFYLIGNVGYMVKFTYNNCNVSRCTSDFEGDGNFGLVLFCNYQTDLDDSIFVSNSPQGTVLYFESNDDKKSLSSTMTRSCVIENSLVNANNNYGLIRVGYVDATLENCIIKGNTKSGTLSIFGINGSIYDT